MSTSRATCRIIRSVATRRAKRSDNVMCLPRLQQQSSIGGGGCATMSTFASCDVSHQSTAQIDKITQRQTQCDPRWSTRTFSTDSATTDDMNDLSSKSTDELKNMVIQAIRQQDPPSRAQAILFQLEEKRHEHGDTMIGNLDSIQTSLIDYWLKYQTGLLQEIKTLQQQDTQDTTVTEKRQYELLTESYETAMSVTDILQAMDHPSDHHFVAILRAWATTCEMAHTLPKKERIVGIPQRTQHILSQQSNPSVESYNQVIKAWAYSSEYLRGTMAEQVFQNIEYPDGDSFRMIIRAHCWSKESRSAFQATGHFMRMMRLLEIGKEDMQPTMDDYHVLCKAWTTAGDKHASSKVYTVLNIMNMVHRKGLTNLRPDAECYRNALITMSKKQNVSDVGELSDEVLKEMKDNNIFPDSECYRAAIIAWKHMAMMRDNPFPEDAIVRAQQLLQEMTEEYHRTTVVTVQPTTEDFNNVLEALTYSTAPKAAERAERLYQTLKQTASSAGGQDPTTYRYLLGVWYGSRSPEKLQRASRILQDLKERMEQNEDWLATPTLRNTLVDAFSAFIRVCGTAGSSNRNDGDDRTKFMTTALQSVKDMKSFGLEVNSTTYAALIEACDHLLPRDGQERQEVMENIFRRACEDGFVDAAVLSQFRTSASAYLYTKMVVANSTVVEDVKAVPESWTRKVPGYKEGKKNMPLSIQGTYTFTKAAAEYRTRRLRQRANQRMLQGGRLK